MPMKVPFFDTFKFSINGPSLIRMQILSHYIPTSGRNRLHLKEFSPEQKPLGTLLFIHGSIEDGRVFYSQKGKGLAPYLTKQGFRCFVLDLRARGKSHPSLKDNFRFDQNDMLNEDFPTIFEFIKNCSQKPFSLVSHSWGGVLINTFLLENPTWIPEINSMVHVSTKRRVSVFNLNRLFYIDLMWMVCGFLLLKTKGYLPKGWYGPEGESQGTLKDTQKWVYSKKWINPETNINYQKLAQEVHLPPALYLTGTSDKCLGHIKDVTIFAKESGHSENDIELLGVRSGSKEDYDHINILTSKQAESDHFPKICHFLTKHA